MGAPALIVGRLMPIGLINSIQPIIGLSLKIFPKWQLINSSALNILEALEGH